MALAMLPYRQHIGAVANINPNSKRSLAPTEKQVRFLPATRITSPSTIRSKYKPRYIRTEQESNYHKLLATSPDGFNGLLIDVSVPEASSSSPSSNISLRRATGPRFLLSVTPPVTMVRGELLAPIKEVSVSVFPHTPVNKIYKGSPLDKKLPRKPMFRSHDSPEGCSLLDTLDDDILSLDGHAVLKPESVASSSSGQSFKSLNSFTSFKVASSLGSPSAIGGEVETGTAVLVESELVKPISGEDFGKAKAVNAITVRSSKHGSPIERVKGLTSMSSDASLSRRAARYNVGPSIRKASDCHAVIMGSSPHPPRTSSLPKPVKSTSQLSAASRLSRPTAASAARAAEAKKTMLNPGKTFLNKGSTSKSSISRPSDSRTSLATSTTTTSLKKASKGLKSRFSEIFSGRRHTTLYSYAEMKSDATIADNEDAQLLKVSTSDNGAKRASKLITTYRNSGMNQKINSTENLRGDKDEFMGKLSDKERAPHEQRRHEREEHSHNVATGNVVLTRGVIGGVGLTRTRRNALVPGGDDEPPTPPPTRDGPAGHYGETNDHARNVAENIARGVHHMTQDEFDLHLTTQLDEAEASLREAIDTANNSGVEDETMIRINVVLHALGNSIVNSRQVLMAGIELRAATTNLIEWSATRADIAHAAIIGAVHDPTTVPRGDEIARAAINDAVHDSATIPRGDDIQTSEEVARESA